MIPFKELQDLADEIRDKTGQYCTVSVEHHTYSDGDSRLKYVFYILDTIGHRFFNTVNELKYAMKQIINPKPDKGISVKED